MSPSDDDPGEETAGPAAGLEHVVLGLVGHVQQLTLTVAALQAAADGGSDSEDSPPKAGNDEGDDSPPRPWCWLKMSHIEKADRLTELADWVREVLFAWPAAQRCYTSCWMRHWDVIEDLSMLYLAWRTAYLWPEAGVRDVADFLDRLLPSALVRAEVRLRPCEHGHHPDGARRDDSQMTAQAVDALRNLALRARAGAE